MSGPIIVFDSGIGGLSVLQHIQKQLPNHDVFYLFDNARLPYGDLEEQVLITGCVELITEQVTKLNAQVVVVACNTASTLVLPALRQALTIPVVGVVPAIKPAAKLSQTKHIALLATPGTVNRQYTKQLISNYAHDCKVALLGTSEMVMLAEAKLANEAIDQAIITEILQPLNQSSIDTIVLGCTHFPLLISEIKMALTQHVTLLDSGVAIAKRVESLVGESKTKKRGQLQAGFTKQISEQLKLTLVDYGFSRFALRP
ncbi:glutamate racemase [Shewanella intestini]|uniref:Glutamate racemase n=1 Tax=Shewanella intestini TaxID=2017544 RepID=A0ABS5I5Q7_9GAMM|nr:MULTISPECIES: glutamate racemase [Shewanella]MBR9729364.1 glutamate racemase [Shewanella intestini]MRG37443.1 glutamate racemase [Shewanella sp. XMDDZSB0408]